MQQTQLKGGHKTSDPRLDRVPQRDPRSRSFPVSTILEVMQAKKPRSYTWRLNIILDQGQEGACVGFGWTHEALCKPSVASILNPERFAREQVYKPAQRIDEWPGENYEGTSVLAGAKMMQQLGAMKEYRWAFSVDDVIVTLGYLGPVVFGLNWYEGMRDTDERGFIKPEGQCIGGHCLTGVGVSIKEKYVLLANSWGSDWGQRGFCKISFDDLNRLLHERGEACVPLARQRVNY